MPNQDLQDIVRQEQERLARQQTREISYRKAARKNKIVIIVACVAILASAVTAGAFILKHVRETQEIFDSAEAYAADGEYISAVRTFAMLGKASVKHEQASIRIQELYDGYYEELMALITDCMESGSDAYILPLQEAAEEYYPSSKEVAALQQSYDECGDPMITFLSDNIIENLSYIVHIQDQPNAKCAAIRLSIVSNTEALIEACFQEEETGTSYSRYFAAGVNSFKSMNADEYTQALGEEKTLDIQWRPGERSSKQEADIIHTNLVMLAQANRGEITIEDAQSAAESSHDDHRAAGTGMWFIMLLVVGVVVYSFWALRGAIKFILRK